MPFHRIITDWSPECTVSYDAFSRTHHIHSHPYTHAVGFDRAGTPHAGGGRRPGRTGGGGPRGSWPYALVSIQRPSTWLSDIKLCSPFSLPRSSAAPRILSPSFPFPRIQSGLITDASGLRVQHMFYLEIEKWGEPIDNNSSHDKDFHVTLHRRTAATLRASLWTLTSI